MFVELEKLLGETGAAMSMHVVAVGNNQLTVTILPKGNFKDSAMGVGLSVTGTPLELDSDLPGEIERYSQARLSLKEQADATIKILEAAALESKQKASTAIKGATASVKPTKPVAKPAATHTEADDDQAEDGGSEGEEISLF